MVDVRKIIAAADFQKFRIFASPLDLRARSFFYVSLRIVLQIQDNRGSLNAQSESAVRCHASHFFVIFLQCHVIFFGIVMYSLVGDEPATLDCFIPLQEDGGTDTVWQAKLVIGGHVTMLAGHELRQ